MKNYGIMLTDVCLQHQLSLKNKTGKTSEPFQFHNLCLNTQRGYETIYYNVPLACADMRPLSPVGFAKVEIPSNTTTQSWNACVDTAS